MPRFGDYLALEPLGMESRVRLYRAIVSAGLMRVFRRGQFISFGQFLPAAISVRSRGLEFVVRAGSDDLEYVLPRHKPSTELWFTPRRNEFVVDVGAGIGFYTLRADRMGAFVLSIEANPATFAALQENLARNGATERVRPVCCAAGNRAGRSELRVPGLASGFSSLRRDWVDDARATPASPIRSVAVPVRTLDQILDERSLTSVDWLLIDVEGSEAAVLAGAPETLRATARVVMEVDVTSGGQEVAATLEAAGLQIVARHRQSPRTEYWLATRRGEPAP
ncbi:MAG: FkbM family methyltransferase [Thermoplasmata archaeon]|nr:FkbM family methyltransferase [Thermoplasmata archaeon]